MPLPFAAVFHPVNRIVPFVNPFDRAVHVSSYKQLVSDVLPLAPVALAL